MVYEDGLTAVAQLKEQGYSVYTIEQVHNSISLENFNYQSGEKIALVFGNEAEGVSEELIAAADGCI